MNIVVGVIAIVIGIGFVVARASLTSNDTARDDFIQGGGRHRRACWWRRHVPRLGARGHQRRADRLRRGVHGPCLSLVRRERRSAASAARYFAVAVILRTEVLRPSAFGERFEDRLDDRNRRG